MKADISAASITRRSVMVSANVRKSIVSAEGRSIYNRLMKSTTAYVGSGTIVGACRLGLSDESIAIVVSGVATLSAGSADSALLTAASASTIAALSLSLRLSLSLTLSLAAIAASSTGSSLVSSRSNAIWSRIESSIKPAKSGLFKQSESMKRVSVGKSIVSVSPNPDCI